MVSEQLNSNKEVITPQHVDLQTEGYTEKFRDADIYAKKAKVNAVEITAEGLANGDYSGLDVRQDKNGAYVIDTYIMAQQEDGSRIRQLETTREVTPGKWIVTNPAQVEGDYPNSYAMGSDTFAKKYDATDESGVYRAKGMARIIKNDTGAPVEIIAPWGEPQMGDTDCYFAVNFTPDDFDEIGNDRYILSENDFATYGLATDVLGIPVEDK